MKQRYKIVIVDDHEILRDGMKYTLSQIDFADVIAEARTGKEFLQIIENISPDVVLMDIAMPEMDGIEATKEVLKKYPELKIIALTMFGDEEYYFKMVHAGARGFVLKKSGIDELEKAIATVVNGENYFSNELLRNIIVNLTDHKFKNTGVGNQVNLTKREIEILQLLCNGLSNSEIAEKLHLSVKTIENHKNSLHSKTNSKNTVSLVMYAIKNKIVNL